MLCSDYRVSGTLMPSSTFQQTTDGRAADRKPARNFRFGEAFSELTRWRLFTRRSTRTAQARSLFAGLGNDCRDTLTEDLAFKFCEYREKASHRTAACSRKTERFGQRYKRYPQLVQFLQRNSKVGDGPPQRSSRHTRMMSISRRLAAFISSSRFGGCLGRVAFVNKTEAG